MNTYDTSGTVAVLHYRLGDLKGSWEQHLSRLAPISQSEIDAVIASPAASWAYAVKVIESSRAKTAARRSTRIKTRDGEEITATERELRRAMFESSSNAIALVLASMSIKRDDIRSLSDVEKERLTSALKEQAKRDKIDDDERSQLATQRGEKNKLRLQQLLKGDITI